MNKSTIVPYISLGNISHFGNMIYYGGGGGGRLYFMWFPGGGGVIGFKFCKEGGGGHPKFG